jgi:hypothetical protein
MRARRDPRVVVFTMRGSKREIYRSLGYEYEDAIVSKFHDGGLVEPVAAAFDTKAFRVRLSAKRRWLDRFVHPTGRQTVGLDSDADLFFAYPASIQDLRTLSNVRDWRTRSDVAICHLQELWAAAIPREMPWLRTILNRFDHVICTQYNTVQPLSRELDVPVSYLAPGVDAEALCPWPDPPVRVIDACAIGKMDAATHDALWDWDQRTGRYYRFTTEGAAPLSVSHVMHRQALSRTLQRSRYFFTYRAKRDRTEQRAEQDEFGPRYFEGAAAGAIQIGEKVHGNPAYAEHLDWEGAVVEAEYSEPGMPALIEALENQPEWVAKVRQANVVNCLMRHDHLHRWERTLEIAGFAPTAGMVARRDRLQALADQVAAATAKTHG